MKKKYNILQLIGLFILQISVAAQTVNIGKFYISPHTPISSLGAFDNKFEGDLVNDGEFYFYNDYNNNGLVTFTAGTTTGITVLKGLASKQKISGEMSSNWNNVQFDNSFIQPAFLLINDITVSGNANFLAGILNNKDGGGKFIFENNSTAINVSDMSYVNSKVEKKGVQSFRFPIGDKNNYRFAEISAPEEIISSFNSAYYNENSNLQYPHTNKNKFITIINNQEYWTLDKSGGISDIILTLSWNENSTTPSNIIKPPLDAIHIVRWDFTTNIWIDEGGIVDAVNKTVTTPTKVSGYSIFTTARIEESSPELLCHSLTIYNLISPNEDGLNDFFKIEGLTECSPDNTMEIFNRWGVKVFETIDYGINNNVFRGVSNARTTISPNELLPTGTYFYVLNIKYKDENNIENIKKAGYIYLTR